MSRILARQCSTVRVRVTTSCWCYEFFQNTLLNAIAFTSNLAGVPRQNQHVNVFGGDVSGLVIKNKLFFSFSYFDWRQVSYNLKRALSHAIQEK
jgi:hypothetical protein